VRFTARSIASSNVTTIRGRANYGVGVARRLFIFATVRNVQDYYYLSAASNFNVHRCNLYITCNDN
jgi:hypothetical protein